MALVRSYRPRSGRASISITDLRDDQRAVLRQEGSDFATYVMSCIVTSGYRRRIARQVVDAQSIPSPIAAGFGVSIVPSSIAS